jgi:hypothetical protein
MNKTMIEYIKKVSRYFLRDELALRDKEMANLFKQLIESKTELTTLKEKFKEVATPNAIELVNSILDRPINWIKWDQMPRQQRKAWSDTALVALNNEALVSLIGTEKDGIKTNGELIKNLIEHSARYAVEKEEMRDMRMIICGVELVRDKLQEMIYIESHT